MSRAEKRLTAKQVANARAGRWPDGGGLYLEVDDKGRRSWIWRYRFGDRRRDMGLGSAHDVSLAQARQERDRWRQVLSDGQDPIQARAAGRAGRVQERSNDAILIDRHTPPRLEMSRRPSRFREIDVTRALRAAQKAGGDWAVEIAPDGTIRIVPADPIAKPKRKATLPGPFELPLVTASSALFLA